MSKSKKLFTLYELYIKNGCTLPFWIKATENSKTCLKVVGWSKFIEAKNYQGVPVLKVSPNCNSKPEYDRLNLEDFKETGTFVGIRLYADTGIPVDHFENIITVSGASSRSWLAIR